MSTLQVANIHFESTGNNRLQYIGSNTYNIVAGGTTAATVNTTSFYAASNFDVAGTFKVNGSDISTIGEQTIWVPATAMYRKTGATGPTLSQIETTTNKVIIQTYNFDSVVAEYLQFAIQMPKSWNEGSINPQYVWSHAAATSFNVAWSIQAVALASGNALDSVFSGLSTFNATGGVADTIYTTSQTARFTPSGTPTDEEYVVFQVTRNVSAPWDTLDGDARLHGVRLKYTVNAGRDD